MLGNDSRTGEVVGGLRAHCPLKGSSATSTIRVRVEASSVVRLGIVGRAQVQHYRAADPTASIPPAPALAGWDGGYIWGMVGESPSDGSAGAGGVRDAAGERPDAGVRLPLGLPRGRLREHAAGPIETKLGIDDAKKTGGVRPTRCPTRTRERRKPR